jgi:probable rRNA maturation factor
MELILDLQIADNVAMIPLPDIDQFSLWVHFALDREFDCPLELTLRIVSTDEMQHLNKTYRHKDSVTNVLSFPAEIDPAIHDDLLPLGDIVLCAEKIVEEAQQQEKPVINHWAHLTIHGVLHLCGYDHITDDEAEVMEEKEIAILHKLNIPNPY